MNWKYYEPKFEYEEKFQDVAWPWAGHKRFAYDLIANIKPKRIVELGTHKGTSLFSFAQSVKDNSLETELNAVDTWEGEKHAGFYGEEVIEGVKDIKNTYYEDVKINLLRKTFDEAMNNFKDKSIDILHIDGLHTYEAVKHDFDSWIGKVSNDGIVLFHDVKVNEKDFGVHKLWQELKQKYKTIEFSHSFGLGVLFLNKKKSEEFISIEGELQMHYLYIHEVVRIGNINKNKETINQKEQQLQQKQETINQKEQQLQQKDREINFMQSSKFWKLREINFKIKFVLFSPIKFIKKQFNI